MIIEIEKTVGYDMLTRSGQEVLHRTLTAAGGKVIDEQIRRDIDMLLAEAANGIQLGGGKIMETAGLVRLLGYLREISYVAGLLPLFGVRFSTHLTATGDTALSFTVTPPKEASKRRSKKNTAPAGSSSALAKEGATFLNSNSGQDGR